MVVLIRTNFSDQSQSLDPKRKKNRRKQWRKLSKRNSGIGTKKELRKKQRIPSGPETFEGAVLGGAGALLLLRTDAAAELLALLRRIFKRDG